MPALRQPGWLLPRGFGLTGAIWCPVRNLRHHARSLPRRKPATPASRATNGSQLAIASAAGPLTLSRASFSTSPAINSWRISWASAAPTSAIKKYGDAFAYSTGEPGGLLFGSLADRFGRRPTMIATILMYSIFPAYAFANSLWQVAVLRLGRDGCRGEYGGRQFVAEVFPKTPASCFGIFHATSILTWMAALADPAAGAQWRYAYLIGVLPALLVLWVRRPSKNRKPESQAVAHQRVELGSWNCCCTRAGTTRALGMMLAAVGLATSGV